MVSTYSSRIPFYTRSFFSYIAFSALFFLISSTQASASISQLERINVPNAGTVEYPNQESSQYFSLSGDGRYGVFLSEASNLVSDDTNNQSDAFLYDGTAGTITRVSVAADGTEGDGSTGSVSISSDARYIVFSASSSNLVADDTNNSEDIFLYDRQSHTLRRLSVASDGTEANDGSGAPTISNDGRYVAFLSNATNLVPNDTNNNTDVFLYDTQLDTIERISTTSTDAELDSYVDTAMISGNGQYVVYDSPATNIVPNDTNDQEDVFRYDIQAHTVSRVSVASGGTDGDGESKYPSISDDGRYVAFQSDATNLIDDDTNGYLDVFVRDMQSSTMRRVSIAADGTQANERSSVANASGISRDGTTVIFISAATNLAPGDLDSLEDVLQYNLGTGIVRRVSNAADGTEANDVTYAGAQSADGEKVLFLSPATNLLPEDAIKIGSSKLLYYRDVGENTLVEIMAPAGTQANNTSSLNSISNTGRFVTFTSNATNLVSRDQNNSTQDVFVYDRQTALLERISVSTDGVDANDTSYASSISSDGRYVALISAASNLGAPDGAVQNYLYLYDRQLHAMTYITDSVTDIPSITPDGRYIAYTKVIVTGSGRDTSTLNTIEVYDTQSEQTEVVSVADDGTPANADCYFPSITPDGRYVAYNGYADNLVPGDTNGTNDIFVYDRQAHTVERVSVASDGTEENGGADGQSAISGDGRYVVFVSPSSNLVADDTNNAADIFVHDRQTHTTERVSIADDGAETNGNSSFPSISSTGQYVAFSSSASNLVNNDENGTDDVFIYDRGTHTIQRIMTETGEELGDAATGSISSDGNWIAIASNAPNLVSGDTNGYQDIFLAHLDRTGPAITAITATVGTTTVTITWTTDVAASSVVAYGSTTGYGSSATGTGSVTSHTVTLSGLTACTMYHFAVTSEDANSNSSTSSDQTVTTTGCTGGGGSGGHGSVLGGSVPKQMPTTPASGTTTCTATTSVLPKGTLTKGMITADVGTIQRFLHDHGYYNALIDNNFGSRTEAAIKSFQSAQQLPATGIWDATVSAHADTVILCTAVPAPTTPGAFLFSVNLHLGMTHPDVLKLQQYLNTHGAIVSINGSGAAGLETNYFGARTKAAVALFQSQHGITPTAGFFGPITRAYINTH